MEQFQAVLPDYGRVLGPNHPDTLAIRSNVAVTLQLSGHVAEALDEYRQLLADQERVLGSDHAESLMTRYNIADALQASGQPGEAIKSFEALLADQIRILGWMTPSPCQPATDWPVPQRIRGRSRMRSSAIVPCSATRRAGAGTR